MVRSRTHMRVRAILLVVRSLRFVPLGFVLGSAGCHLFASGAITKTCENIPACTNGGQRDDTGHEGQTDTAGPLVASRGIALSYTTNTKWWAVALVPPDLSPAVSMGGDASSSAILGAAAYDASGPAVWVVSDSSAWELGAGQSVTEYAIEGGTPSTDALRLNDSLYWTDGSSLWALAPDGSSAEVVQSNESFSITAISADGADGVWLLDCSSSGPSLVRYDPAARTTEVVASSFDDTTSRCGADVFPGPDGDPEVCSLSGAVYSVSELADAVANGTAAEAIAFPDAPTTDVLACGWDEQMQRWVIVSASLGVYAIPAADDSASDVQIYVPDGDFSIVGGAIE